MSRAFVLGNGISRQGMNLHLLKQLGQVYGCNAIHREFVPDVLVSTDTPISKSIQETGYSQKHKMYTRKPLPALGALRIPQEYYGYSSGPAAAGIAALDHNQAIYLIGFDMGPTATGKFNNVYADSEFYRASSAPPTFTGNWATQILKICNDFPTIQFYRVIGKTTADVPVLNSVTNLCHMCMEDFFNRINNTKEL
jgi:hypothetical protein